MQTPAAGAPRAYLNYILLDEKSFKMIQSGAASIPQITGTMQKQLLQINSGSDITVTHNGYLYVWVSNESKGNVYFDDIRVEHLFLIKSLLHAKNIFSLFLSLPLFSVVGAARYH